MEWLADNYFLPGVYMGCFMLLGLIMYCSDMVVRHIHAYKSRESYKYYLWEEQVIGIKHLGDLCVLWLLCGVISVLIWPVTMCFILSILSVYLIKSK